MRSFLRRSRISAATCALIIAVAVLSPRAAGPPASHVPRLIVLLVVDQMRGDYVDRFEHQWTAGLHRLVTQGAWFRQARYPYYNTITCAGHASISTGDFPAVHGMVLNAWWDRGAHKMVNCADDDSATSISYGKPVKTEGESVMHLRTTTLADELSAQLEPAGRTIAFSLKARSAATLGGHRPAAVAWFDDSGTWVTSSAFAKAPVVDVANFIKRNPVERDFGKVWDRALPKDAYAYEDPAVGVRETRGMTTTFPHALKGGSASPDRGFYDQWQSSPYADEYLAHMSLDVADRLKLGKGASTDMLAIGFSTLDKVGHDFGPNSHEIQDILIRLDRTLGELLTGLDRLVGAGNYTLALSADHGVAPIPERLQSQGIDAGRVSAAALVRRVEETLSNAFGPGHYVDQFLYTDLYLAPGVYEKLRDQPSALRSVRDAIRSLPGIQDVYTRDELVANRFDDDPMGRRFAHSYYPGRSGDLLVMVRPYWMVQAVGTTHGTGYDYDTLVPVILMGKGIVGGEYLTTSSPIDIAPTLAFLAGVTLPRPSGRVLAEALAAPDKAIASHQNHW